MEEDIESEEAIKEGNTFTDIQEAIDFLYKEFNFTINEVKPNCYQVIDNDGDIDPQFMDEQEVKDYAGDRADCNGYVNKKDID